MGKAPATSPSRSMNNPVPLVTWTRYRRKAISPQDNQEEHRASTALISIDSIKRDRKKKISKTAVDNQKDGDGVPASPTRSTNNGWKKKKKRQLPDSSSNQIQEQDTSQNNSIEAVPTKHKTRSLLKQLMYKRETHIYSPSSTNRRSMWKPKLRREEEEEEEERAYTTQERQHLKEQARSSSRVKPLSRTENEVKDIQVDCITQVESDQSGLHIYYPTFFPIHLLESSEFLRQSQIHLHRIVLEDFMMEPTFLYIECGDIVVWKVSVNTLGMVEHCLEVIYEREDADPIRALTPPLKSGNTIAWRFQKKGRVHVQCTVYQTQGVVVIGKEMMESIKDPIRNTRKSKLKKKRSVVKEVEDIRLEEEEDLHVFHPSVGCIEQDVGVCRAVLSQLEDVAQANSSRSVILIGDVECQLTESNDPFVNEGAEKEETNALDDFQMRIISMLQHSEANRLYHRTSFQEETSGFDAGAAYDFFKQRFSQVQHEEKNIFYSRCPEHGNPEMV